MNSQIGAEENRGAGTSVGRWSLAQPTTYNVVEGAVQDILLLPGASGIICVMFHSARIKYKN